jgi:putative endonuclease
MSGHVSYHAGLSAEESVEKGYLCAGYTPIARRFRGKQGEIDLILQGEDCVIFVEVKKSRSHARAAERLSARQIERLFLTASEFLECRPDGQNSNTRFDVALVDGQGRVRIIENALAA